LLCFLVLLCHVHLGVIQHVLADPLRENVGRHRGEGQLDFAILTAAAILTLPT
jgi:hypothetical protein